MHIKKKKMLSNKGNDVGKNKIKNNSFKNCTGKVAMKGESRVVPVCMTLHVSCGNWEKKVWSSPILWMIFSNHETEEKLDKQIV